MRCSLENDIACLEGTLAYQSLSIVLSATSRANILRCQKRGRRSATAVSELCAQWQARMRGHAVFNAPRVEPHLNLSSPDLVAETSRKPLTHHSHEHRVISRQPGHIIL